MTAGEWFVAGVIAFAGVLYVVAGLVGLLPSHMGVGVLLAGWR